MFIVFSGYNGEIAKPETLQYVTADENELCIDLAEMKFDTAQNQIAAMAYA